MNVRLVVIGATIPDAKLAFEGSGEAGVEAEVSEKRMAADSANASKAALKSAVKQAVDQAVVKLALRDAAAAAQETAPKRRPERGRSSSGFPVALPRRRGFC